MSRTAHRIRTRNDSAGTPPSSALFAACAAALLAATGCGGSAVAPPLPTPHLPDAGSADTGTHPDGALDNPDACGLDDAAVPDAGDCDGGNVDPNGDAGDTTRPDASTGDDAGVADADAGGEDADAGVLPAILTPTPGATLQARIETFTWSAGADEYWLSIGTTRGGSELLASDSLGTATSLTFSKLPLDGKPLFVTLRARIGTGFLTATADYTASLRKALCVVADFADVALEAYRGAGMKSLTDVNLQLREMETHWNWLSRGKEKAHWDLIRVTLLQKRSATAFPGWIAYREEVARLVKQTINVADYDVDRDGVIDAIWIICPDGAVTLPWLIGGASRNNGANIFVDGQSGQAVVQNATGCFNHEFGHCLGLPDLYGPHGTVAGLTLMASPWEAPQNDLTAYERMKLGWVEPTVVSQTTQPATLHSANTHLEALLLPTNNSYEYFLLEYRTRPRTGFGSLGAGDGLAVYHVFEPSSQQRDPPLLKLEPADGVIGHDVTPSPDDFLLPGNEQMRLPLQLKSYLGDDVLYEIDHPALTATPGELQFDVVVTGAAAAPANLLPSGDFESGSTDWTTSAYKPASASFDWAPVGHSGSAHSLSVESLVDPNDAGWQRRVTGLLANRGYLLCGWLKGDNVVPYDYAGAGANVGLAASFEHTWGGLGTFDWVQQCMTFTPSQSSADLACKLGGFGSVVTGKIWCDDLTVFPLRSAF